MRKFYANVPPVESLVVQRELEIANSQDVYVFDVAMPPSPEWTVSCFSHVPKAHISWGMSDIMNRVQMKL